MAKKPGAKVGRGRKLSDADLWRHVTRDVTPLQPSLARRHLETPLSLPEVRREEARETAERPPKGLPKTARRIQPGPPPKAPPLKPRPELLHGDVRDLDRRSADRLKRGQLPIEARLDLHGLTQVEAQRALEAFLAAGVAAGRRCVLVITGKGGLGRAPGGSEAGVLRRAVPQWLNLPHNRERVLAFSYALPKHGGNGALYLLLKRQRGDV